MLIGRPSTAWSQTATYRPGSALKPQSAYRPPTAAGQSTCRGSTPDSGRPSTSSRPVSNLSCGELSLVLFTLNQRCSNDGPFPQSPYDPLMVFGKESGQICCCASEVSLYKYSTEKCMTMKGLSSSCCTSMCVHCTLCKVKVQSRFA